MQLRHTRIAALILVAAVAMLSPASVFAVSPRTPFSSADIGVPQWVGPASGLPMTLHLRMRSSMPRATVSMTLYDAADGIVWRRTRSASALRPVEYAFSFARSPSEGRLAPGVYRLVASVLASDGSGLSRTADLVVTETGGARTPVSVVVRVTGAPQRAPDGSWIPSDDGLTASTEAAALGDLAWQHPELRLTVAVPPYLLDEWRALATYTPTSTPVGEALAAQSASAALDSLSRAATSGVAFLRVPYADPDLVGLAKIGSTARDLPAQLSRARGVTDATLPGTAATEATGEAGLGDVVTAAAGDALPSSGVTFVIADQSCLRATASTVTPVPYRIIGGTGSSAREIGLTALVVDRVGSREVAQPGLPGALAARLYERSISRRARSPLVIELLVGPGAASVSRLAPALSSLARLPWVRLVDAPTAAAVRPAVTARFADGPREPSPAPAGYWDQVGRAVTRARALVDAAGPRDPDGVKALSDAFMAESRGWAGADGSWALAPRGEAYASAADGIASRILSSTTIDAPPLVLSGSAGKVPVSITNRSSKVLSVVVRATSSTVKLTHPRTYTKLRPGENILYVPVDLLAALRGQVTISTYVDGIRLAVTTTTVQASGLDRIVIIAAALLLMLVLLAIIWRRARRPAAAAEPEDDRG